MDGSQEQALNQNPHPIPPQNSLVIREDYFVHQESPVFPPTHHEDLPVVTVQTTSDESEPSEPSSQATSDFRSRAVGEAIMRRCQVFKGKVVAGIVGFGSYAVRLCSVLPVTAVGGVLVLLLFLLKMKKVKLWLPWRERTVAVRRDDQQRLLLLLKDKDEKISQLLLQIDKMNETLSARRKVPIVRIK